MNRRLLLAATLMLPAALAPTSFAFAEEEKKKKEFEYLPIGDFTINVPTDSRHPSYVVVGVTVEARPDAAAVLKDNAPRVKEAVMRRLMDMAAHGEMQPGRTDALTLKDALLETLLKLQPEGLHDVLITRILYS
jgi:hypothetical protein